MISLRYIHIRVTHSQKALIRGQEIKVGRKGHSFILYAQDVVATRVKAITLETVLSSKELHGKTKAT